jgi:hypothetical protein
LDLGIDDISYPAADTSVAKILQVDTKVWAIPSSNCAAYFVVAECNPVSQSARGGWGFAQFKDGKPADAALLKTCFPGHEPVKTRDFVFTRYAP